MNIQQDDWLCSFVDAGLDTYICSKCGIRVSSDDGPPPLQCSLPSATAKEPDVPFLTKVKNFVVSASDHIQNGRKLCTDDTIEQRYKICEQCEYFTNSSCGKCGCPIIRNRQFISKLSWASSECPVGKWKQED